LVHRVLHLEDAVKVADIIVIGLPVDVMGRLLPEILSLTLGTIKVVIDVGSTKAGICDSVQNHPRKSQICCRPPIAGTENLGPDAAFDSLLDQKRFIVCNGKDSYPWALEAALWFVNQLEMQVTFLTASVHDRSYAYVFHLSHVIFYSLRVSLLEMEKEMRTNLEGVAMAL
jgi:prephenate dehydrogenase